MAKANSESWDARPEFANYFRTDARVARSPWAWRNANSCRIQLADLVDRDLIISFHGWISAQLAENLDQIVSERIVVIDDQQFHFFISPARATASSIAFDLFTHSRYSELGSESATIPAPV